MKFRTEHIKVGKDVKIPEGWKEIHTTLIEPKNGEPYFAVLMKQEKKLSLGKVGFKL